MIVAVLERAAATPLAAYDPVAIIRAVNALQPLGPEKALGALGAYLASRAPGQEDVGLFWVLRVLFEMPAERGFPPVQLGQPTIPPPTDPTALPRYPIVVVQDIPLLAIRGYNLAGLPEPVEHHMAYFRAYGTLRPKPLAPPASLDGIEEDFLRQWRATYGAAYVADVRATIQEQIARLRSARP